jgi:hypothetical protein
MHMSKPNLGEGGDANSVWFNSFTLAIPNVGKIQGQKSLFNISDRCSGPQEKFVNYML